MPAFNEEDVIAAVIDEFSSILERFEHREFIVVNDCSTDGTLAVLQALQQRYPYLKVVTLQINSGHGPALWRAYQESKGDFVFHCDSDRQFLPDDFWLLWEKLHDQDLDVEIGVRTHRKDALSRLLLTRLLRFSLWLLFGVWLQDSNSPFRL